MQVLGLGFVCDNACAFCAQAPLRAGAGSELVIGAPRDGWIAVAGGEPLLVSDLIDRLSAVPGRKLLQTNARRLVDVAQGLALRHVGVDALEVAVHGAAPELHDYHTGVRGSFVETARGVQRAREAGLVVTLTSVVTRSNYRHLEALVDLAVSWGAASLRVASVAPHGAALERASRLVAPPALVAPWLTRARARASSHSLSLHLASAADPAVPWVGLGFVPDRRRSAA
jgi:molybdenum cofactor biosynthesis enzyme MoaA